MHQEQEQELYVWVEEVRTEGEAEQRDILHVSYRGTHCALPLREVELELEAIKHEREAKSIRKKLAWSRNFASSISAAVTP